ncbi:cytochrome c-type biogenesis protein CcmH [bacterium SCSIO 12696]|nr:cytochrome c-type biogenesis protein CcmH [bacterium SCSIO 12696]
MRIVVAITLLLALSVQAAELETFSNEDIRARYLALIDDLRCPKCQNQNLSDSDSTIAQDLRRTVLRLLEEGKSDDEVVDFLVDRYGDFIIYMPQFKPGTYSLWLLPLLLAVIGGAVVIVVVRRQRQAEPVVLSDSEQAQLADMLASDGDADRKEPN